MDQEWSSVLTLTSESEQPDREQRERSLTTKDNERDGESVNRALAATLPSVPRPPSPRVVELTNDRARYQRHQKTYRRCDERD